MKDLIIPILCLLAIISSARAKDRLRCCATNVTINVATKRCNDGNKIKLTTFCDSYYKEDYDNASISKADEYKETYCIGSFDSDPSQPFLIICFPKDTPTLEDMAAIYKRQVVLELISVVFLVLTVGVYSWLPQLRSLQSKCLVCLCASQAVAYSLLAMLQIREINSSISLGVCKLVGYSAYFWFLSTFFWTSVVSINLFLRVNDPPMLKKYKTKQSLMFAVYAIFAWSASLLLLLITITADHIEGGHLKSGIGTATCWINGNVETWAFFYGPVSFLIAVNVALFVATSIKLWSAAMTYERSALVILKRRFMLSLRLFLVMGVSWIFEIASYAHGGPHVVWAIADTFNYLLGVWFFILLVIRKPVLRALASKGVFGACGRRLFQKKVEHDVEDMLSDEESPREIQLNKFSKTSPI